MTTRASVSVQHHKLTLPAMEGLLPDLPSATDILNRFITDF